MAKTRPPAGRPPNRRGRGGIGPGPAYRPTEGGGGTNHKKKDCCPMVAALTSIRRGKLRLARRYALMSIRLIACEHGLMGHIIHTVDGTRQKRCVPRLITWNWHFNRRPRGRYA